MTVWLNLSHRLLSLRSPVRVSSCILSFPLPPPPPVHCKSRSGCPFSARGGGGAFREALRYVTIGSVPGLRLHNSAAPHWKNANVITLRAFFPPPHFPENLFFLSISLSFFLFFLPFESEPTVKTLTGGGHRLAAPDCTECG